MKSLGFLGSVFDTGLSVTPLMGHLGCLASHWSVPVKQGVLAQEKSIASVSNLFHLIFSEIVYSLSSEFHSLGVSDRAPNNIFTRHHGNFELTSVSCSLQLKHRKLLPFKPKKENWIWKRLSIMKTHDKLLDKDCKYVKTNLNSLLNNTFV